jgi:hypothetical protein
MSIVHSSLSAAAIVCGFLLLGVTSGNAQTVVVSPSNMDG